jgi:cobalt-zinc-cadmium efflux system outer membrane protein
MRARVAACGVVVAWSLGQAPASAQAPALPTAAAHEPGTIRNSLGQAPGSGAVPFNNPPGAGADVLSGRAGPSAPRVPSSITTPGGTTAPSALPMLPLPTLPPNTLPVYGPLSVPRAGEEEGPPNGLTLDQAIERLVRANLDLQSRYYEIPQAQADVLTASLRANPIFYADSQLIPYGNYSEKRPGGPTQYDININHPLDLSHKRQARTEVACRAKRVLEAMYQDAVRLQLDNLYTAYVDVLAARATVDYSRASVATFGEMLRVARAKMARGNLFVVDVERLEWQKGAAELGMAEAIGSLRNAHRTLGVLLNIPVADAERLPLRGTIHDWAPPPPALPELLRIAWTDRPDLVAQRLGISRAEADVRLALANRFADVYVLTQPYTFQNNGPFDRKSGTSWALGITVPLPLYNSNQGNIARARLNVDQTRIELTALEQQVIAEVVRAAQEYDQTRAAVERIEKELLPSAGRVVVKTKRLYESGEVDVVPYLTAQKEANDLTRQYRDTLVRHRKSMLRLNTAVGRRILP